MLSKPIERVCMLILTRNQLSNEGTFGTLAGEDGIFLCYMLERPKTGPHPCIESGIYTFNAFISPTKGEVWLRDDAAANDGRSMIEIHSANLASELRGCLAPGNSIGELGGVKAVLGSKDAMKMLKSILGDTFQLQIIENFNV